jgi:hypothetical protein
MPPSSDDISIQVIDKINILSHEALAGGGQPKSAPGAVTVTKIQQLQADAPWPWV